MDETRHSTDSNGRGATWVVVLAGGDGSRLRAITTTASGLAVPKQFCSLRDGPSLLNETLQRAASIAEEARICTVVAQQHERWWRRPLQSLPPENVIVQPRNCGTAVGLLLPLVDILDRDPNAHVVVLPSDHHFGEEAVLRRALARAVGVTRESDSKILLLGIAPEFADSELGYIVPGRLGAELSPVSQFAEKPSPREAQALIERGALWNVFVLVAQVSALVALLARAAPLLMEKIREARRCGRAAMAALYGRLSSIDFSHDVARGNEASLAVLRVPPCGWTDLGTPERLQSTLARSPAAVCDLNPTFRGKGRLSLQRQHLEWARVAGEACT
jgi:mannose-1-phosphate guanylyltransferase